MQDPRFKFYTYLGENLLLITITDSGTFFLEYEGRKIGYVTSYEQLYGNLVAYCSLNSSEIAVHNIFTNGAKVIVLRGIEENSSQQHLFFLEIYFKPDIQNVESIALKITARPKSFTGRMFRKEFSQIELKSVMFPQSFYLKNHLEDFYNFIQDLTK